MSVSCSFPPIHNFSSLGAKHAVSGRVGGGVGEWAIHCGRLLVGAMCQPNPGSLSRLVRSFCRNGEGL